MYTIYALISKNRNWIYVDFSADIDDRIRRHQQGYEKTTSPYRPFMIVQLACALNRPEARRLEKWYKTAYGKNSIRTLLNETFSDGDTGLSADR
ncbi:GIY-YIG nuclease family protein [Terrimonas alba]|uniref:GIY-YIG nuclease family protein n=1 Tax=Terrimonas alba TaxID=3349636 RepID=UPI0035F401C3